MLIRTEEEKDYTAVRAVNVAAFETPAEANLVDALREHAHPFISLVAEEDGEIIGHIMFSPVSLTEHPNLRIMGLGPLAVIPEHQRKSVGAALIRAGLERCKGQGFDAVVVLGHPLYYPSFGFLPSTRFDIGCEYDVPAEVFMVMELQPGTLNGKTGTIKYDPAFSNV
ncbi:MAG: N-acetyltransferase [Chloroflexota bacterium]|nr:N-acetyltransferase [Chloroflexota bacterium]